MNRKIFLNRKIILVFVVSALVLSGCSFFNSLLNTMSDLQSIQFKLGSANNFSLANVNISDKRNVSDVSVTDVLKLTQAVKNKSLPTNFTLNVLAQNPNTKTANTKQSSLDAVLSNFDWILLIDDKETINGRVTNPVTIPSGGRTENISIGIGLDLMKFFGDRGYDDMINLAMAVGGVNGSSSRLKLRIKPSVSISGIPISYPNYITVVDKEFRGK
jgi:hypothetical protein